MTPEDLVGRVARAGRDLRLRSLVATVADARGAVTVSGPEGGWAARRYEIGSVTKLVTGVLLADMVLAGEVSLADPLRAHLDRDLPWADGAGPTLGDLATHRSGLPNTPRRLVPGELATAAGLTRRDPWAGVDDAAYRGLVAAEARRARPGVAVAYSSLGIGLLGDALAARAGMPYERLATERVLRPLGMHRSTFDRPAGPDAVVPGRNMRGTPVGYLRDRMPAAGALASTSEDVTRLVRAGLPDTSGSCGTSGSARVHRAAALAREPRATMGPGISVGLAWLLTEDDGVVTAWHNGATWGSSAFAAVRPADGTSVVALTNTCRPLDAFGAELLEAVGRG